MWLELGSTPLDLLRMDDGSFNSCPVRSNMTGTNVMNCQLISMGLSENTQVDPSIYHNIPKSLFKSMDLGWVQPFNRFFLKYSRIKISPSNSKLLVFRDPIFKTQLYIPQDPPRSLGWFDDSFLRRAPMMTSIHKSMRRGTWQWCSWCSGDF